MTAVGYGLLVAACAGWLATVVCWHREITRHQATHDALDEAHDGWAETIDLAIRHGVLQYAGTPGSTPGAPGQHHPDGDQSGSTPAS